jgi:hypothetical protein
MFFHPLYLHTHTCACTHTHIHTQACMQANVSIRLKNVSNTCRLLRRKYSYIECFHFDHEIWYTKDWENNGCNFSLNKIIKWLGIHNYKMRIYNSTMSHVKPSLLQRLTVLCHCWWCCIVLNLLCSITATKTPAACAHGEVTAGEQTQSAMLNSSSCLVLKTVRALPLW